MTSPLDSESWYRVCGLRPRLHRHVRVHRHRYRGARWFVLENPSTGRIHRLDEHAYRMIAFMDGKRTLDKVWLNVSELAGDLAPTQDETIQLLGQLHAADILYCDVSPDARELFSRYEKQTQGKLLQAFRSPFFVRLPLLDPERWLKKWLPYARPLFSYPALAVGILLVLGGAIAAAINWQPLFADARLSLLSPGNLFLLWLVYPIVKALHELGHALAVKFWGGEVHDTGVMLLVFMPVPYVDASAANAFEDKRARMVVAGAGIAVELALAAVAMFVWLVVEPGLVRMLALNVMTIGGVSTLLFNGNPLLKFDGYYVLSDLIEIPNLGSRASQYYGYLLRRYALGVRQARSPAHTNGERNWFLVYGFASFVYRTLILIAILLLVAAVSLTAAVVLGAWAIAGQIAIPFFQKLNKLLSDPLVRERRLRVVAVSLGAALLLTVALTVPVPQRSTAEGIVWMSEDARVRAGTDCFVDRLLVVPDTVVSPGTPLVQCSDPFLDSELAEAEAHLRELRARLARERSRDRARAQIVAEEVAAVAAQLDATRARADRLLVRSQAHGVFVMPAAVDLPQRFVEQGELLGFVIDPNELGIRVAIGQSDIGLVRGDIQRVAVRLGTRPGAVLDAGVRRLLPGATTALPGAALGSKGGGLHVADPADESGATSMEPVFVLELTLSDAVPAAAGARVYVRFDHSPSPLAAQWYRDIRQLLLRRLAV